MSTACPLYLAMKLRAPTELIDHLLYGSYPQVPQINHKERRELEMSPLFLAIFQKDESLLKKLVELGHEKNQFEFMVTATCNGIPPMFFTLLRQEKLLLQAKQIGDGKPIVVNGKEKKMSLKELTTQLAQLQKISEYVIQYDVDIVESKN